MSKQGKANRLGCINRRQLLNIGRYLEIDGVAMMSNRALITAIRMKRRSIPLSFSGSIKESTAFVIEWFHKNENEAIKSQKKEKKPKPSRPTSYATNMAKEDFYRSWEWRTLRMQVLKEYGSECQCCGAGRGDKTMAGDPVRICVDHIKPLSKYWDLRLERSNLQVLCDECNQGKGAWDETDHRSLDAIKAQLRYTL